MRYYQDVSNAANWNTGLKNSASHRKCSANKITKPGNTPVFYPHEMNLTAETIFRETEPLKKLKDADIACEQVTNKNSLSAKNNEIYFDRPRPSFFYSSGSKKRRKRGSKIWLFILSGLLISFISGVVFFTWLVQGDLGAILPWQETSNRTEKVSSGDTNSKFIDTVKVALPENSLMKKESDITMTDASGITDETDNIQSEERYPVAASKEIPAIVTEKNADEKPVVMASDAQPGNNVLRDFSETERSLKGAATNIENKKNRVDKERQVDTLNMHQVRQSEESFVESEVIRRGNFVEMLINAEEHKPQDKSEEILTRSGVDEPDYPVIESTIVEESYPWLQVPVYPVIPENTPEEIQPVIEDTFKDDQEFINETTGNEFIEPGLLVRKENQITRKEQKTRAALVLKR